MSKSKKDRSTRRGRAKRTSSILPVTEGNLVDFDDSDESSERQSTLDLDSPNFFTAPPVPRVQDTAEMKGRNQSAVGQRSMVSGSELNFDLDAELTSESRPISFDLSDENHEKNSSSRASKAQEVKAKTTERLPQIPSPTKSSAKKRSTKKKSAKTK